MKYSEFKKIELLNINLLYLLGCLKVKKRIIEIDNYPDFDATEYNKSDLSSYVMYPHWDYSSEYSTVIYANIVETKLYTYDDIEQLEIDTSKKKDDGETAEDYLTRIRPYINDEVWNEYGVEPDIDGFKLTSIKISNIDNTNKKIMFKGGYVADSMSIQPTDWSIYCECDLIGISIHGICENKLYVELLAESYALLGEFKYKLAYFLSFVALENYINQNLDSQYEQKRLKEKINELFNTTFINLANHEIYNSIIGKLKNFEAKRNNIAHGRETINISAADAEDILEFVLILICSVEKKVDNFSELKAQLLLCA